MKVPENLFRGFDANFQKLIADFCIEKKLISNESDLNSPRFLARSVVPHILKLSTLFNRQDKDQKDQADSLAPYWKESSNPEHLRLAYFLYFMPSNLFRMASIWSELSRLGYQWKTKNNSSKNLESFRGIEFGAGPASGVCGLAAGEWSSSLGLPKNGSWALIEQDRMILDWGKDWAKKYFQSLGHNQWEVKPFHRKLDLKHEFLPRNAPSFHLWLFSYYLNEVDLPPAELAHAFLKAVDRHLEDEGLVILMEPALKLQSRKLLTFRRELLMLIEKRKIDDLKVLTPCLGHQACGALASENDWCHEEVTWWRPPYFQKIDKMAELDRKTLPFSYLVIARSKRSREELLPALQKNKIRHRLVSPAHSEGQDSEFFVCGMDGKRRARYRDKNDLLLERGDVLLGSQLKGSPEATRIEKIQEKI